MMKQKLQLRIILTLVVIVSISAYGQDSITLSKMTTIKNTAITALTPSGGKGHQFVLYGDSCSGGKATDFETNFARVNNALAHLDTMPEFICFLGDHIAGNTKDYNDLRCQWRYWLTKEMGWLDESIHLYHTTSNHNTYDVQSEIVFREIFPNIPANGPSNQKGLTYFIRCDDLLLVFVNTSFSGHSDLGGDAHVEHEWLDHILVQNQDARFKLVLGHHPILPVNGYEQLKWIVVPDEGKSFWDVLVRHGVSAYICSHIIAFDVRVKQGVLQILTGGAGTSVGPGGFMPGQTEYLHFIQMVLDRNGLRYQVVDDSGFIRETLCWPLSIPTIDTWLPFMQDGINDLAQLRESQNKKNISPGEHPIMLWRFNGQYPSSASGQEQTFVCGWESMEGPPTLWVGLDCSSRLTVRLIPVPGGGIQIWEGPRLPPEKRFDVQIAIHAGMGPGGVMWRADETSQWSSLFSSSSRGAENTVWPAQWVLGQSSELNKKIFRGKDLKVSWKLIKS